MPGRQATIATDANNGGNGAVDDGGAVDIRDDSTRLRSVEECRERNLWLAEYPARALHSCLDDVSINEARRPRIGRKVFQRLVTIGDERDLGGERAQLPLQSEKPLVGGGAQDDGHPCAH